MFPDRSFKKLLMRKLHIKYRRVGLFCSLFFITVGVATSAQWEHLNEVLGTPGCAARHSGDQVDVLLMINEVGQLILVAGRADWHFSGPEDISLRIDDFDLTHLQASAFNNLVLLPISDEAVVGRLKTARDIYWSIPSAKYHAAVSGFGDALLWVQRCEQERRLPAGRR